MGGDMAGRPQSRRDRGMTALIEGFFGFVWFGWGETNASARLRVGLSVRGRRGALLPLGVAAGRPAAGGTRGVNGRGGDGGARDRPGHRRRSEHGHPPSGRARCSRRSPWLPWPRERKTRRSSVRPIDRCDLLRGD
jgi:hypothetical protein